MKTVPWKTEVPKHELNRRSRPKVSVVFHGDLAQSISRTV